MSEMWGDASEAVSDWSLPGDAEIEARMRGDEAAPEPTPEPAAEPAVDAEPVAEEPQTPERERNEKGQFVARQPEETPAEAEARLYAGKYKSAEDLERAHQELERRLGEQGSELGQYRQYLEQIQAQQQQVLQNQQSAQVDWEGMLENDPVAAADLAREHRNEFAYRQALQAMDDTVPGWSRQYEQNLRVQYQLAQFQAYQQQALAPVQQQQEQQVKVQAWRELIAEYPDAANMSDDDFQQAAMKNIEWAAVIDNANATPAQWKTALKTIYLDAVHSRGPRNGDTLDTAREVARAQAEATLEAKREGMLASATANTEGGPKLSPAERLREQIGAEWEASRQKLDSGWNL